MEAANAGRWCQSDGASEGGTVGKPRDRLAANLRDKAGSKNTGANMLQDDGVPGIECACLCQQVICFCDLTETAGCRRRLHQGGDAMLLDDGERPRVIGIGGIQFDSFAEALLGSVKVVTIQEAGTGQVGIGGQSRRIRTRRAVRLICRILSMRWADECQQKDRC